MKEPMKKIQIRSFIKRLHQVDHEDFQIEQIDDFFLSSSDEFALVSAAKDVGAVFYHRKPHNVLIRYVSIFFH